MVRFPLVSQTVGRPVPVGVAVTRTSEDRVLLPPSAPGYDGYAITVRPAELRCTSKGGLAITPSAQALKTAGCRSGCSTCS